MTKLTTSKLQIFELKQLADLEDTYKAQCRKALAEYKQWGRHHNDETDIIALLYGNLQGEVLRRNAQESIKAYWTIRKDFRKWFQRYLMENNCYPANKN